MRPRIADFRERGERKEGRPVAEPSNPSNEIDPRSWRIVVASICSLILAVVVAGVFAIVVNERVNQLMTRTLRHDIGIEDEGDDLREDVLDLWVLHNQITVGGPTPDLLAALNGAHAAVLDQIDRLDRLGIADTSEVRPEALRLLADRYYAEFRAATDLYVNDPAAFRGASDEGLRRIEEIDRQSREVDRLGDRLSTAAVSRLNDATATERYTLIALVGGAALVGVVLAIASGRVVGRLRASYAREQAAASELARALRTKTDFVADASHELRTPLAVIRGNAEIGLASSETRLHREALADILARAAQMGKLVDDLLFLARSDAGVPPLDEEFVPVRWLLKRLTKPADVLAQQHGRCLTAELGGEGLLEADAGRIEQAVQILVDNAAKHSPPDACVALSTRVVGGELIIEVADAGPGIAPEEVPLIFDRFYQVGPRRARKKDGSGLGLSIAKTIVDAHGGSIDVASGGDRGTTMTIRLPLAADPSAVDDPFRRLVSPRT
jgi:signal transduction histidine kinase